MNLPTITESLIQRRASDSSFERGYHYYEGDAVLGLTRRGHQLHASVEGSDYLPYEVTITLTESGIEHASCTCPYDWGGDCKHIVATLLSYVHAEDDILELPPIEELLAELSRDQLQALLVKLVEQQPKLTLFIQNEVGLLTTVAEPEQESSPATPRQRRTSLDPETFRRQVRHALNSVDHMSRSDAYWHTGDIVSSIEQTAEQAQMYVQAGDGDNALIILKAITEEYIEGWTDLDDSDGELGGLFDTIKPIWTEAILTANLTADERQEWVDLFTEWQEDVDDYGVDGAFDAPQIAALQGWDYPPLLRVFGGEITELGAWENEAPWCADELATARLNVLERQGKVQEYLYLAEAEGQTARYLTKLAEIGRIQESVEYGINYMATADEALQLAKTLSEAGETESSMRVAEHGLQLTQPRELALWLRDRAIALGNSPLALQAGIAAVHARTTLVDYEAVREIAGEDWPGIRESLLAHIQQAETYPVDEKVDILLSEGLIESAIEALGPYAGYGALERVADAAVASHPEWVIRVCSKQADDIMDAGKSAIYHHAIKWLQKVRAAYLESGQREEWSAYHGKLLEAHGRKYKLVPMLRDLK